jgi:hypothetical protein
MNKLKLIIFMLAAVFSLLSLTASAQVTQRWAARNNGSGNNVDAASDMIIDNSGNAYVCGNTYRSQTGSNDATIIKYDSAGTQVWAAIYNGPTSGGDYAVSIALDNAGNVYAVGRSQSSSGFDIITLKFNSSGGFVWERRIDGAAHLDDFGRDITMDAAGNICITGDADLGFLGQSNNIVIAKYDPNGNLAFSIYSYNFSGSAIDIPYAITTDASNNIYVTGTWGSDNGLGGVNSQITTLSLSPSGTLRWAKQYGDPLGLPIEGYDVKCDFAGNVIVTGKVQSTTNGQYQAATIKYNSANGNIIWANRFTAGGSLEDITKRIAIDDSNNVYVTGYNYGAANRDQIIVKYTPSGTLSWGASYNHPTYNGADEGQDLILRGRWLYTAGWVSGPTQKDYLILKYDRFTGEELWGKSYFGPSSGDDGAFRIGLDASQNVYVTGNSYGGASTNFDWATVKFVQTPPPAPALISPANNAVNVTLTPVLDWSDVAGADTYQLQVSTSSSFTTNVISIGTLTASTYTVPSGVLSSNTQYYWRVTALNEFGFSAAAGPWSFTTIPLPPAAPNLLSPVNGATGTSLTPLLDWQDVAGATTYSLQVSTNSGFSSTVVNQTGLASSQYTVPGGTLQNNVLYYWRVSAVNPGGQGGWSAVWNFRPAPSGLQPVGNELPREFKLYDNYPNPFNPVTKIRFDIASAGETQLIIYDILGKAVASLVDERLEAGVYEVSFQAGSLASGVYFFRLNTGSYVNIKKMVLAK